MSNAEGDSTKTTETRHTTMTATEIKTRIMAIKQQTAIASKAIEDTLGAANAGVDVSGVWSAAKKIIDRGAQELSEIQQKELSREIAENLRNMKVTFRR